MSGFVGTAQSGDDDDHIVIANANNNNNNNENREQRKQCIWIVRYGLTKFPLVEYLGPYNSPLDETEGMSHANAIANALREDVMASTNSASASDSSEVVHVYSSPFTRTTQTANLIAHTLSSSTSTSTSTSLKTTVRVEEGLTEWQQKSLLVDPSGTITYPLTSKELVSQFPHVDVTYESVHPQDSCHPPTQRITNNSNNNDDDAMVLVDETMMELKEESEEDLFERCRKTLEGMIYERAEEGQSFIIVSHAPCDQAMAVYFEGHSKLDNSTLGPWPLGGITKVSRELLPPSDDSDPTLPSSSSWGPWEIDYYGCTDHMPGPYQGGLKAWSLPTLSKREVPKETNGNGDGLPTAINASSMEALRP